MARGKQGKEYWFDIGNDKQIIFEMFDWRNSILNWTIHRNKKIYHISIEFLRFKIFYHDYGSPI